MPAFQKGDRVRFTSKHLGVCPGPDSAIFVDGITVGEGTETPEGVYLEPHHRLNETMMHSADEAAPWHFVTVDVGGETYYVPVAEPMIEVIS